MTLDNGTDGQTDRRTDRRTDRVRRNMRPPPREEGRIIMHSRRIHCERDPKHAYVPKAGCLNTY